MFRCLVVAVFVLMALITAAPGAHAGDPPQLAAQRSIEIPDTRLIAISPDGKSLAASDPGLNKLCIYEVETLAERVCADLAPLEAGLRLEDVVWSPDSTRLVLAEQAFVRFIDGDLWLMDATTGDLTNLTDDGVSARLVFGDKEVDYHELFIDVSPTWMPDGSGITFSRSIWRDGKWHGNTINTVPVGGGEPALLTIVTLDTPGVVYFGMRWTADASKLIYSVNPPDSGDPANGIWSVNAGGLGAGKLIGIGGKRGTPVIGGISPSADTILVYYPMLAGSYSADIDYVYALLDVPSGDLEPVTPQIEDAPDYITAMPAVPSPDGQFVLYVSRLTIPDHQVFIRSVGGGEEFSLVPDGLEAASPISLTASISWANDGTVLLHGPSPSAGTLLTVSGVTEFAATPQPDDSPATPTPVSSAGDIVTGATVTVNDNDVPLRSAPGTGAQTVATMTIGTELTVVGPAKEADGFLWIPVTDPATGTIGYIRKEFVETND